MADIKVYCYLMLMVFQFGKWRVSLDIICLETQRESCNYRRKNILLTNLNSGLGQVDFKCYFFTHKNIGISSFAKQRLENVELSASERRSFSSLLSWIDTCNYKKETKIFNKRILKKYFAKVC